jgi:hypothetical protein
MAGEELLPEAFMGPGFRREDSRGDDDRASHGWAIAQVVAAATPSSITKA